MHCVSMMPAALHRRPAPSILSGETKSDILSGADAIRVSARPAAVKRPLRVPSDTALDGRPRRRARMVQRLENSHGLDRSLMRKAEEQTPDPVGA